MPPFKDRTGHVYGRLTVISRAPNDKNRRTCWNCICECGSEIIVMNGNLQTGQTRSCGCYMAEKARKWMTSPGAPRTTTHGAWLTPEWYSWSCMKQRVLNPNRKGYKDYGGRGITICPQWRHSFSQFLADMGPRPKGTSLDRIDVDGNYEPGNCRWATRKEQQNNQRRHKKAG